MGASSSSEEDKQKNKSKKKNCVKSDVSIKEINLLSSSLAIIKTDSTKGNGFFFGLPFKGDLFKVLVVENRIVSNVLIKLCSSIEVTYKSSENKLKIELNKKKRQIITFEEENITIIEIIDTDKIDDSFFLEVDSRFFTKGKKAFIDKEIFIIDSPGDKREVSLFSGKIEELNKNEEYSFFFSTDNSQEVSGSPIFAVTTKKIVGVSKGRTKKKKNLGTFIGYIIQKIDDHNLFSSLKRSIIITGNKNTNERSNIEQKISITVDVGETNINKDIYFLGIYYDENYNECYFELEGAKMFIDDNEVPYTNHYKFDSSGEHKILYEFKEELLTCKGMFRECKDITKVEFIEFCTNDVKDMKYMFYGCTNLESLDLSTFVTDNVIDMTEMFDYCCKLKELNLSTFNTKNVTDMKYMFDECSNLTDLNVSSFNTENVINMGYMFKGCSSLDSLNLSSFNTKKVVNCGFIFYHCSNLKSVEFSSNCENIKNQFNRKN